ncbi:MAG: nucleotidyltransferase domain-containing protein [Arcobacteraceae bacterium]|nr:nucleotidyltransferase domain-containing protein [Candidatus Pacearchaeota archaeon]MCK5294395.1 nucleotidyltransferase domain-containing protein [Arcobacteraceae bacterium]
MKKGILKKIKQIEKDRKVKVLFLIESGSRAWRWESEDSDYDVRGVYVQDYLKVGDLDKQIIIVDGELDIVLWDFRKFLKKLINIFKKGFSEQALKQHYVSMARQNFEKYIKNSGDKANLKKYVYVLRSVACVLWIGKYHSPPPKDYKKVAKLLPKEVQRFFNKIVEDKRKSESLEGSRNKEVEKYVCGFFNKKFDKTESNFSDKLIDKIFKTYVMELK